MDSSWFVRPQPPPAVRSALATARARVTTRDPEQSGPVPSLRWLSRDETCARGRGVVFLRCAPTRTRLRALAG